MSALIELLDKSKSLGRRTWLIEDKKYGPLVVRELTGMAPLLAQGRFAELLACDIPQVAGAVALVEEEDRIFIKRQWVKGKPLEPVITPEKAAEIVKLMSLLPSEFVLYDLRPEHIIQTDEGLIICDPGYNETGTSPYCSPEQLGRGDVDVSAGDYQLGATLVYLLSGKKPPDALTLLIPDVELPEVPGVPKEVSQTINKLFEADPCARPTPSAVYAKFDSWLFSQEAKKREELLAQDHAQDIVSDGDIEAIVRVSSGKNKDKNLLETKKDSQQNSQPLNFASLGKAQAKHNSSSTFLMVSYILVPLLITALILFAAYNKGMLKDLSSKGKVTTVRQTTPTRGYLPSSWINPKDGSKMILIAAGSFYEGPSSEQGPGSEPIITDLPAYYIDRFEVTNEQFAKFVADTGYKAEGKWRDYATSGRENHPVICVSWYDAQAYATWAGKRLPSAEEWEKAARGRDARLFPWGDVWESSLLNCFESGLGNTTPVGSYPKGASPYGVEDMSGNVWEWVDAWYVPIGAASKDLPLLRMIRGGSRSDKATECAINCIRGVYPENCRLVNSGFRCVFDPLDDGTKASVQPSQDTLPAIVDASQTQEPQEPGLPGDPNDPQLPEGYDPNQSYPGYYPGNLPDSYYQIYGPGYPSADPTEGQYRPEFDGQALGVPVEPQDSPSPVDTPKEEEPLIPQVVDGIFTTVPQSKDGTLRINGNSGKNGVLKMDGSEKSQSPNTNPQPGYNQAPRQAPSAPKAQSAPKTNYKPNGPITNEELYRRVDEGTPTQSAPPTVMKMTSENTPLDEVQEIGVDEY